MDSYAICNLFKKTRRKDSLSGNCFIELHIAYMITENQTLILTRENMVNNGHMKIVSFLGHRGHKNNCFSRSIKDIGAL